MTTSIRTVAAGILIALSLPAFLAAQEIPRKLYSHPVGVTELDNLRVILAPAPPRLDVPKDLFCQVVVTVEILDALSMAVLESFGTQTIGPESSLVVDFKPLVGPPPARQEIVVRTTIQRDPNPKSERGSLEDVCPLLGSMQVYDAGTGRTQTATDLYWDRIQLGNIGASG